MYLEESLFVQYLPADSNIEEWDIHDSAPGPKIMSIIRSRKEYRCRCHMMDSPSPIVESIIEASMLIKELALSH